MSSPAGSAACETSAAGNGIRSDADVNLSGAAQQSEYTHVVQEMKAKNSNYAQCTILYSCTVLLRREALYKASPVR